LAFKDTTLKNSTPLWTLLHHVIILYRIMTSLKLNFWP